jgi:hypothetical protein
MPRYKLSPVLIRVFGVSLAIVGIVIWYLGGYSFTMKVGEVTVFLPLDVTLLVGGLLCAYLPLLPLYIAAIFIPGRRREAFLLWVEAHASEPSVGDSPTAAQLASDLRDQFRHITRRYYATLFSIVILLGIMVGLVLPMLVERYTQRQGFRLASDQLVELVQKNRLDFAARDVVRRELQLASASVAAVESPTATSEIHRILSALYASSVVTPSAFREASTELYDAELFPHVDRSIGLLELGKVNNPYQPALESDAASSTLLTLFAVLAIEQGSQGQYILPYLQARQLLGEALKRSKDEELIATTHNALGIVYSSILHSYDQYEELYGKGEVFRKRLHEELEDPAPISRLQLARMAEDHYEVGARIADSNFLQARFLNNRADLRMRLITLSHIQAEIFETSSSSDEDYLRQRVQPFIRDKGGFAEERLAEIFTGLKEDLDRALLLSREPSIFFTRAQLYSLAGELSARYEISDPFWADESKTCEGAIRDLATAASLGLGPDLFTPARAEDLLLRWVWDNCDPSPRLPTMSNQLNIGVPYFVTKGEQ